MDEIEHDRVKFYNMVRNLRLSPNKKSVNYDMLQANILADIGQQLRDIGKTLQRMEVRVKWNYQ